MRLPTAIVAATAMIALTFVQVPANATPPCDPGTYQCCNVSPTFLYCAFDNHLFSDPTEMLTAQLGEPSVLAGCSVTERQLYAGAITVGLPAPIGNKTVAWKNTPAYQAVASMGGCLALPARTQGTDYHVNIAMLGGADDNLIWGLITDAQVCFYDASFTVIECQGGFSPDDTNGGFDDSITQLVGYQSVPLGAAYFDIEAPSGSVNVISAFWQDSA